MTGHPERPGPLVRLRGAGFVPLLRWTQRTDGSWWASVLMTSLRQTEGFSDRRSPFEQRVRDVPAGDVERVDGEDYSRVRTVDRHGRVLRG
ncbi:hypothetical protein [Bailinhaonella thermotolerans]|uniref:hypothetical protein n=1 Tax=Bailinhaonella thermotolerans TaxID=1070861 RepID=UPI0011C455BA|nr:hypothetical protein [Bailinhaonella thermotolerans]